MAEYFSLLLAVAILCLTSAICLLTKPEPVRAFGRMNEGLAWLLTTHLLYKLNVQVQFMQGYDLLLLALMAAAGIVFIASAANKLFNDLKAHRP